MDEPPIPLQARVRLAHAVVQVIAEQTGVDVLHVKGPALDAALLDVRTRADGGPAEAIPRYSSDADVLVRPSGVPALLAALAGHGWATVARFTTGSPFEHAATLQHPHLGHADIHRRFPGIGIDPADAFEALWQERGTATLAGIDCPVPSLTGQRLVLLLHAARNGGPTSADAVRTWVRASADERAAVRVLAERLSAELGLAAATGHLDDYAGHPEHDLWRAFAGPPGGRLAEWRARVRAARSPGEAVGVAARALLVNTDHLARRLGHRPSPAEVSAEYLSRFRRGLAELTALLRGSGKEPR